MQHTNSLDSMLQFFLGTPRETLQDDPKVLASKEELEAELTYKSNASGYMAITVTIDPKIHDGTEWSILAQYLRNHLHELNTRHILIPAINSSGDIHWHGVIHLNKPSDKPTAVRSLRRYIGMTKWKYIGDPSGWVKYVMDEHQQTEQIDDDWRRYVITDDGLHYNAFRTKHYLDMVLEERKETKTKVFASSAGSIIRPSSKAKMISSRITMEK